MHHHPRRVLKQCLRSGVIIAVIMIVQSLLAAFLAVCPWRDLEVGATQTIKHTDGFVETVFQLGAFGVTRVESEFKLRIAPSAAELIESLKDEDWLVRRNAAESLARLGAKEAIQPLLGLREDENTMVQETVEAVLASLGWTPTPQ